MATVLNNSETSYETIDQEMRIIIPLQEMPPKMIKAVDKVDIKEDIPLEIEITCALSCLLTTEITLQL